jgi:hypothetical protein
MEAALSVSTTSANARTALLAVALLLSACGAKEVVVQGAFPRPVMEQLPLTLGVYYDEAFRQHEFFDEATGRNEATWIVKTGQAQVDMYNTLLPGMFVGIRHLDEPPGSAAAPTGVDAILVPRVAELQYSIPLQTKIKVYEIWMRYAYQLYTPDGELIADWTMTSYGKTPTAFMQTDQAAVNLAAVVALRDAGANFATGFTRVPAVRDWLSGRQQQGLGLQEIRP